MQQKENVLKKQVWQWISMSYCLLPIGQRLKTCQSGLLLGFFVARAANDVDVEIDGSEIHEYQWCLASKAIALHQQGDLSMMPPTVVTLTELAAATSCEDLFTVYAERNVRPFIPRITYIDDVVCMLYQGDAGYDDCNPRAQGPRNRLWMEETGSRYENTID
jgi:hypothetical protein